MVGSLPIAPFQKALGPSIRMTLTAQSAIPLYVACPCLAITCNLVLITSAGVNNPAAGTPAMKPAVKSWAGPTWPLSSANANFICAYTGKYIAENGISRRKHADAPCTIDKE